MARAKKEAVLNPEERLQAALVPDWEWPYKLSENWCWTTIGVINRYIGSSIDPMKSKSNLFELYSVPSSADNFPEIVPGAEIGSTKQSVEKGDVLLCKINPRINRVWKVSKHTENALIASSEWIVVRNSNLLSDYLMWCFRSQYFREYMLSNVSGVGGSLMRAQPKHVQGYPIPLPPLYEQQRIVDRIESLFAKLDEAKEKVQEVVDGYEARKAAILHKAFTGELTAKWREEHGVGMESWRTSYLSDVGEVITGSTPDTKHPEFYGGNVPFIKPTELNQGRHIVFSADNLTDEGKAVSRPIRAGSTCICCIGATISKCGFLDVDAVTNQQINSVVPHSFMDDNYVYYYCCSSGFKNELISNASATTLPIINKKKTSQLKIIYPTKLEQTEIVRILDDLFAKEQQAHDAALATLNQIDIIKKSILARAFRGELGTNDPTDEPAVELLKKII